MSPVSLLFCLNSSIYYLICKLKYNKTILATSRNLLSRTGSLSCMVTLSLSGLNTVDGSTSLETFVGILNEDMIVSSMNISFDNSL